MHYHIPMSLHLEEGTTSALVYQERKTILVPLLAAHKMTLFHCWIHGRLWYLLTGIMALAIHFQPVLVSEKHHFNCKIHENSLP